MSTGWQGWSGVARFMAEASPLRPGSLRSPDFRSMALPPSHEGMSSSLVIQSLSFFAVPASQ